MRAGRPGDHANGAECRYVDHTELGNGRYRQFVRHVSVPRAAEPVEVIAWHLAVGFQSRRLSFSAGQAAGHAGTVVLFHKATRVRPLAIPNGTKIEVNLFNQDDDGCYRDYSVTEDVPPTEPHLDSAETKLSNFGNLLKASTNLEEPKQDDWSDQTLAIAENNIELHVIEAVTFRNLNNPVRRHRWEIAEEPKF